MNLSVGDRVLVGSDKGFVRYHGQVEGFSGTYIGIEWDDSTRGKHDGVVKGKRYFTTTHPTGGSLVRPNLVSAGEDLETEVSRRYGSDENTDEFILGTKTVEMVGLSKGRQKSLCALRAIVLDHMQVSHAAPHEAPLFPRCLEMNLFGNLLSRWRDVVSCLQQTPLCKELVLSANRLERIDNDDLSIDSLTKSPNIRRLTLNRCNLDEYTIIRALSLFPNLEELYAVNNDLRTFGLVSSSSTILSSPIPSTLTLVDLEENSIESFDEIRPLALLPNLVKLSVARCRLSTVRLPRLGDEQQQQGHQGVGSSTPAGSSTGVAVGYAKLHTLNLKANEIRDWESIGELRLLPALGVLYIDCDRFHAEFGMDPREVIIAKLPQLKNLERCELSIVERRSAEIRYLNKYSALSEERIEGERHAEDLRRLEMEHGAPVLENAKTRQLAIVKITFAHGEKCVTDRSIPTTLSVQKLIDMARRLFGLSRHAPITAQLDQEGHCIDLDNPMRQIGFYDPQNGDVVRIR